MKSQKYYIPAIYIAVSIAWIFLSDKYILLVVGNSPAYLSELSIFKGVLFILVTGLLFYIYIGRLYQQIQDNLHLEDTLNSISDSFLTVNKDWIITKANRNFYERTGIADDVVGKEINMVFPGSQETSIFRAAKRAMQERIPIKISDYYQQLNKWLQVACYPTKEGIAVYFTDITAEKEQESQLQLALERYDLASKATGATIYDLDLLTGKVIFSEQLKVLTEMPEAEMESTVDWWRSMMEPEDALRVLESFKESIHNNVKQWDIEYRILTPAGGYKYICDQCYVINDSKLRPIRIIGSLKDIDALKRNELQIRRMAEILDKIRNPVVITNPEGMITWVNAAFTLLSGYSEEECLGSIYSNLLSGPKTDAHTLYQLVRALATQGIFTGELLWYTKARAEYWVSIILTPIFNAENKLESYISVEVDMTERKAKEAQIGQQRAQLKTVSWLNSHQIRKPVASILGLIHLIKASRDEAERAPLLDKLSACTEELDLLIYRINAEASTDTQIINPPKF
jgi:PAS domain S-box-containing protein